MITVYRFASGSCDGTNIFGHAAIAFNGLTHKECFAISQMGEYLSNPTWHNSPKLLKGALRPQESKATERWRRQFFEKRKDHAFPRVLDKSFIISNEDLAKLGVTVPEGEGLSERKAFKWWQAQIRNTQIMSSALEGADCADTVMKAIDASMVRDGHRYAWSRTPLRFFITPQAVVDYARATQEAIEEVMDLTQKQVAQVRDADKMWRLACGTYDHLVEGEYDKRMEKQVLLEV